jgi:uncharacterized NAD-dependent epimerase/dehydratase family protein
VFSSLKEKPNVLLVGIAINTVNMTAKQIREAKKKLENESHLPVAEVLTNDVSKLLDSIQYFIKRG